MSNGIPKPFGEYAFPDGTKDLIRRKIERLFADDRSIDIESSKGSFIAELVFDGRGVEVSNLGDQYRILEWEAFYRAIEVIWKCGGTARKGWARQGRLGSESLRLDTVEGWVANQVYGIREGNWAFARITPITHILRQAGIVHDWRGELTLTEFFKQEIKRRQQRHQ